MEYRPQFWDRFWVKVDFSAPCWEWMAYITTAGYGGFGIDGRMRMAHRVSYELLVGDIPDGLHLDHLCRNKACVNPDHLEPVTPSENARRATLGVSTTLGRRMRVKTHCPSGHAYTHRNSPGRRVCQICHREACRKYRERKALNGA